MCRNVIFGLLLGSLCALAQAQPMGEAQHRLFLLGNTGDLPVGADFYAAFKQALHATRTPFTVLVNGDLLSQGFNGQFSAADSFRIQQLLLTCSGIPNGPLIILPGDRDWARTGKNGWQAVMALERMVKAFNYPQVTWALSGGCPGPRVIELAGGLRLIALQTQWWNQPYAKPRPADALCRSTSEADLLEEIKDILDSSHGKNVLIAGHYPLQSLGPYGGHLPLKTHLFPFAERTPKIPLPLPILGSLYASFRQNVGTPQDIVNAQFDGFRQALQDLMLDNHSLIYLSGHERNLQVLKQGGNYHINSGAIGHTSPVAQGRQAKLALAARGFLELIYYEHGDIFVRPQLFHSRKAFEPTPPPHLPFSIGLLCPRQPHAL